MIRSRYFVFLGVTLCTLPFFAEARVLVNEVAWMGTSLSANDEWIELYNDGPASIDLTGWSLQDAVGTLTISLSGSIAGNGYFLLERTDDETVAGISADTIYTGSLANGGAHLFLKNAAGVVEDEVNASAGWPAGDNSTKDTMQRVQSAWITAVSTPRAANAVSSSPPPPPPPAETTPPPSPPPSPNPPAPSSSPEATGFGSAVVPPSFSVSGGENKTVAVGTLIHFLGYARDKNGKLLDRLRYLWNFGDGTTQEGRSATHLFQIPGIYTIGVHASTGEEVVADYHTIEVVPNQISFGNVVEGEQGFIRIANPSTMEIDIGGWLLDDGVGVRFVFPLYTKIAPRSEIAVSNHLSRLLLGAVTFPLTLRFPNADVALEKSASVNNVLFASFPISKSEQEVPSSPSPVSTRPESPSVTEEKIEINAEDEKANLGVVDDGAVVSENVQSLSETASLSGSGAGNFYFFGAAFVASALAAAGFFLLKRFF